MIFADYNYYTDNYSGRILTSDNFAFYISKAGYFLNYATMGRIGEIVPDCVKMAACAVAEIYYNYDEYGRISHESMDGYDITYLTDTTLQAELADTIEMYLAPSNLLYRGL